MLKRGRPFIFVAAISAFPFEPAPVLGAECIGIQFPDSVKVGDRELVLNGLGIRKATFLKVKVYVAGLYLPEASTDGKRITSANESWQLVLHFVHDADASDIRDAFEEGFEKVAGKSNALRTRIDALKAQMIDFKKGHALSYAYDPETGTTVDVNGTKGSAIEGSDFAATLLAILIGPKPPNEELKMGLLGGKCE